LFIKNLGGKITLIPHTEEKYISFSTKLKVDTYNKDGKEQNKYIELRFIDSMEFLDCSLDELSKNINTKNLTNLKIYYGNNIIHMIM